MASHLTWLTRGLHDFLSVRLQPCNLKMITGVFGADRAPEKTPESPLYSSSLCSRFAQ